MREIKKILLPIDFSSASNKILQYAIFLAGKSKAKIFIINVVEYPYTISGLPPSEADMEYTERLIHFAKGEMANFLENNKDQISSPFETLILWGRAAERIINYAEIENFDLIVIGTHGHTSLNKMLFGSVADKVIKLAPCPVLTINTFVDDD